MSQTQTSISLESEKQAILAQDLAPFQDLNLLGVKAKVAEALSLIGRSRIFEEYTLHDISHVDKMLFTFDWLIPDETRSVMTHADWLLLVLSTYFHDLGMLVTDAEFDARAESDFPAFCEEELFAEDVGIDYQSKVVRLGDDRERFLYQEYVRRNHATRIGDWVRGTVDRRRGVASDVAASVAEALDSLPNTFRGDLALVCESHHLSDLHNTAKYPVSQPYGDSDEATANVQYVALLLRVADLLHITADRTPSTMFRLINPQDPVSQREWAKQSRVRRIRAQKGRDKEGNLSDDVPKDTVEVFADFEDADAFFGLTSYLTYAENQLREVRDWAETSATRYGTKFHFPWRHIDASRVQAKGFLPKQMSFTIDQAKILDLLTGHTLYNDTSVVIRELVQNALDAVRLQRHICELQGKASDKAQEFVEVEWSSEKKELVVRDTGTGMTQQIIERNLLRAGASRYQEEVFRDQYPEFSPISRFGIGVLSAFMVADSVEITTCSPDETSVHQLRLRSVHGRYLLRLLDKSADQAAARLTPHGTEVRLSVRESAKLPDILKTLKQWVVVPRTAVKIIIDGERVEGIGYESPGAALADALQASGMEIYEGDGEPLNNSVRIVEKIYDGVRTALAVRWSSYFNEWSFLHARDFDDDFEVTRAVGTCVEGIRVEGASAGFRELGVVGLSDARGVGAPKTNVARVGLEATAERRQMLQRVYRAYLTHISDECEALEKERGLSLTWAAQEAEMLLDSLLRNPYAYRGPQFTPPVDSTALQAEIRSQPLLLVEEDRHRQLESTNSLQEQPRLWTVDSALVRAAEGILREIPSDGSLHSIAQGFGADVFRLPKGITLVGYRPHSTLYREAMADREVAALVIRREQRRVDIGWDRIDAEPRWHAVVTRQQLEESDRVLGRSPIYVERSNVTIDGRQGEVAIRAHDAFFVLKDNDLGRWLSEAALGGALEEDATHKIEFLSNMIAAFLGRTRPPKSAHDFVEPFVNQRELRGGAMQGIDLDGLIAALEGTSVKTFDTGAWLRRGLGFA